MKFRLLFIALIMAVLPTWAQNAAVTGIVVEADTGSPLAGVLVTLQEQGISVTTGPAGDFLISNAKSGKVSISTIAPGFEDGFATAELIPGETVSVATIKLVNTDATSSAYQDNHDMWIDEHLLDDDEGNAQSITALTGASDNIYYNASSYNFQPMYFRYRGYDSQYRTIYINGIAFNDLARGRFSYSTLGGMTSRAFRNQTSTMGNDAAAYGFGDIGGSTNFNTLTSSYSPGFNGSVAYTNSNYMMRAMVTYSTGIKSNGWGVTVSAISRYADEGVQPGTFYNSIGAFISLEKIFNKHHSLTLTAFGAPTQRAAGSATYFEAYDLADDNLYNPNWGYQNGKKRSAKVITQFDPTVMLNWVFKNYRTTINTGVAARMNYYCTSALNWYNAADPRPDYYRYLPSYYYDNGEPTEASDFYTNLWRTDESVRQINWDNLYNTNYLNNDYDAAIQDESKRKGSTYILENRESRQNIIAFNSYINHRLNDRVTLQGGISFNYTNAQYYKTVADLLGGKFWRDIDSYAERDLPGDPNILQNDLDNPNRAVGKGDVFGYDYSINALQATAWLQNMVNLPRWDFYYGFKLSYTQYQRDGHMRNGRAPENSLGKGAMHRFDNGAFKVGATYKINGRSFISIHGNYETRAPLFETAYVSPRIKDTTISGLTDERILSGDISYAWNFRRFRGSITGYWTEMYDLTERFSFYDDQYQTFMNYVLRGVHRSYRGVEVGMAFKILPSLTLSAAGTYSRYQYKNRPTGIRSYENGMAADVYETVYLKNFYVGGTPQTAVNVGIDWAAPKSWFFNVNASWMGDAYVQLSPIRHEALPDLWQYFPDQEQLEAKMKSLATQDKMNDAFVLNASIGKLLYINRKVSMNFNLSASNLLNNRSIMTNAYQQGRFDYTNYDAGKYPNKYMYAQGIKIFLNVGIRF